MHTNFRLYQHRSEACPGRSSKHSNRSFVNPLRILCLVSGLIAFSVGATAEEARRPRVLGIAHAAFYVEDMKSAVAFYTEFLGYATPYSLPMPSGGELVWIKINERQSVELFPGSGSTPGSDRLSHIAFETDDADAMRLYLERRDGNRVEIVEYLPTSWTAREKGKYLPEGRVSNRMPHVGVKVGNLDAALGFYRDVFGLKEVYRQSADGNTLSWVNLQVPDGDDYVEFMLYDQEPNANRLLTMHHICLEVDDILATHRLLKTRPLPAGCKHPTRMKLGKNGRWQINCFDPDGSRVEVMEPATYNRQPIPPSDAPPPRGKAGTKC